MNSIYIRNKWLKFVLPIVSKLTAISRPAVAIRRAPNDSVGSEQAGLTAPQKKCANVVPASIK